MPDRLEFVAPLPYRALSQNARGHRLGDAAAVRQYRETLRLLTLEALGRERPQVSHVVMSLEFRLLGLKPAKRLGAGALVPDWQKPYRPRDVCNGLGAMKAGIDGCAEALGVDDDWKHWSIGAVTIVPRHADGEGVRITLALTGAGDGEGAGDGAT